MSDCIINNTNRIPENLVNELLKDIRNRINNPSGIWQDYNCLYNTIIKLKVLTYPDGRAVLCPEDLPELPNIEDYPNLTAQKTFYCNL